MIRWWRESVLRRWTAAHPAAMDVALAVALAALSLFVHATASESEFQTFRSPSWWTVLLTLATIAPLAVRRRHPEVAAVVVVTLQAAAELMEINATMWIPNLVAAYSLGAYGNGRRRTGAALVAAVLVASLLTAGALYYDDVPLIAFSMVSAGAIMLAAFLWGDVVKRRRLEVLQLAARVERAERERELLAAQQVGAERARIARELHDVVAHSVSVMVIQAGAARRSVERAPDDAAALLDNIAATGRSTMRELRQILGVLRPDESAEPEYAPMLGDIDALGHSLPGLDVTVRCDGSWDRLPPSLALQGYRIIQEALTNAHRHAGPRAHVDVDVAIGAERFELRVTDDGRGASAAIGAAPGEPGYGLIGMRERAAAFGGTLRAGPRRSGGWEVAAVFPVPAGPDHSSAAGTPATGNTPARTTSSGASSTPEMPTGRGPNSAEPMVAGA